MNPPFFLVTPTPTLGMILLKKYFPGTFMMVPLVKNLPVNAGDKGLIPGLRIYHVIHGN